MTAIIIAVNFQFLLGPIIKLTVQSSWFDWLLLFYCVYIIFASLINLPSFLLSNSVYDVS